MLVHLLCRCLGPCLAKIGGQVSGRASVLLEWRDEGTPAGASFVVQRAVVGALATTRCPEGAIHMTLTARKSFLPMSRSVGEIRCAMQIASESDQGLDAVVQLRLDSVHGSACVGTR